MFMPEFKALRCTLSRLFVFLIKKKIKGRAPPKLSYLRLREPQFQCAIAIAVGKESNKATLFWLRRPRLRQVVKAVIQFNNLTI